MLISSNCLLCSYITTVWRSYKFWQSSVSNQAEPWCLIFIFPVLPAQSWCNFDQSMSFEAHVKMLTKSCFFHLRNIAKLWSVVSRNEMEMLIHAFISSRLDYCNSLFTCLNKSSIQRLQTVQNAAARLLTLQQMVTYNSYFNLFALASSKF